MAVIRRGRTVTVVAVVGLVILAVAVWPGPSGWGGQPPGRSGLPSMAIQWPSQGESAIAVLGEGRRAGHSGAQPVPIASVAKLMTAYVVVAHFPMSDGQPGFSLTLSDIDVQRAATDAAEGQSYLPVVTGEVLTERQALEALLLPSANNIAIALADRVAGNLPTFVEWMNAEAKALGMHQTTYTDPSGLAPTTVSTAVDQLRLARAALWNRTISEIVARSEADIPYAGTIHNTDTLLGHDGVVGGKTGSDAAAGGCFVFRAVRTVGAQRVTVIGVVLGQRDGPLIQAGLAAADALLNDVVNRLATRTLRSAR
jgi:D-alanyl-D-alanine carboxypeptidase (penicillin-binding protein 5/6)